MTKSALLDVLSNQNPERRPIWFMRQAGRYLPEYRKLREKAGSFLDLCYNPALAAEVTLQPLRRFDLDAAILFSDILVVPHAMGLGLRFEEGEGPVLQTVRDEAGVSALREVAATDEVKKVCETVSRVRGDLPSGTALIGFCGAPWTVASYMIEGGSSTRERAKIAALESPAWFELLIERLIEDSVSYLEAQVVAGAQAVQIFDSWASDLAPAERERWVDRPLIEMTKRFKQSHPDIPVILFARGIGSAHVGLAEASGSAAVGVESETGIPQFMDQLPSKTAVQGNLDPVILLTSDAICRAQATALARSIPMNRHIFNLGHGIKPATEPSKLAAVIDAVRVVDSAR